VLVRHLQVQLLQGHLELVGYKRSGKSHNKSKHGKGQFAILPRETKFEPPGPVKLAPGC
jgi:hypothetical protein